jgi:dipeptidyl aminopeptidase/acylaminoacyl peptidase
MAVLAGVCCVSWAQTFGTSSESDLGSVAGRPMTFADLQRMKRVSDPQISQSGKWVMFSVVDVDLEKNSKVSHLWVVPLAASQGAGGGPTGAERQVTFWKDGESGGRFSPDGKQVLFVATDSPDGLSQIFLAPWDDAAGTVGTPTRLTNVSTEADGAIWSPDSQRILFTTRVYPECSMEDSWLHEDKCDKRKDDAAAGSPVKAQIFDHLLYRHWDHYVGPKRSHVLMVSATDGNLVRDLTPRRDIGDAEAPVFSLGGPIGYAWAPDSKEIAYVTNLDLVPAASTNNDVFTLRLDDPSARPVKISTSMGSDDAPAYSPDGKYLAFRSQARAGYESDQFRLMLFDRLKNTLNEYIPFSDGWIDEFIWSPDSKYIFSASGYHGAEVVGRLTLNPRHATATQRGEHSAIRLSGQGEFSSLAMTPDGSEVVAVRMKVDSPAEIFAFSSSKNCDSLYGDVDGLEPTKPELDNRCAAGEPARAISHVNDSIVAELALNKMDAYWFKGAGNTFVQGFIVRPPNFDPSRKYPVKFLIHGGPQGAWGDAWSYRWNAELMAASGYVVVMVNPRGSTGYGQAFIDGVNGDWGGKAYVDLMKGLDAAEAKYPFIDKARECALGASYGGFMADWILTHTDRFACIVTHDGMFNPQSAYGTTEELWFNEWEFRNPGEKMPGQPWNYFDKPVAQDPFRKWSPMLSIKNATTPTLVIHSQRDYRLDVSEGFQLFTALQRLNVPSRMLYFPDEGHWILKPQNSKLWYETVGDWCDRWTNTNAYAANLPYVAPQAPAEPKVEAKGENAPKGKTKPKVAPEVIAKPHVVEQAAVPAPVAPVAVKPPSTPEVAPSAPEHPPAGAAPASFSIAISVPQDEVRVGLDVPVKITLRNVSDRQIMFGHRPGANNPEFSYEIEVKNAKGQRVDETAYGREARDPKRRQEESRTEDYVQPGGSSVQTAHLAKLVSLSRPGWYTVQASRKDPVSGQVVRSNEFKFAVVP